MNLYGYSIKSKKTTPTELREVTLLLSIEEIDEVIRFMNKVKALHNSVKDSTDFLHTHFSDVIKKNENGVDIIVATKNGR